MLDPSVGPAVINLQTLGELRLDGAERVHLSSRQKDLVLLAYLERRSPKSLARAEAADLLWPDRDERRSRQSLRQALLDLRRVLGDGLIVEVNRIALKENAIRSDATLFEREVEAGQFEDAVRRWTGDFLVDAEGIGGEELRGWLEAERERLRRLLASALAQLMDEAQRRSAWQEMVTWGERWVSALPRDCQGHLALLRSCFLAGQLKEGSARYAEIRTQLHTLDIEAPPEFEQLGRLLERKAAAPVGRTSSATLSSPDLVGRGLALADLDTSWRAVCGGAAGALLIEGELGIGKTKLCEEFLRCLEVQPNGPVICRARARTVQHPFEFGVLKQLVLELASAPGLAGATPKALAELARITPALKERFPALSEPSEATEPIESALREALGAVAEEVPLIVFVDDLPEADPKTRQALLALVERLPRRVLLLATARTGDEEVAFEVPSNKVVRRLKLQPLALPDVELLVGSMLQLPPLERHRLAVLLYHHAGGNPLYIVELVSALVAEGMLAPTKQGEWRLDAGHGPLPLPSSLHEVIAQQLARLSPMANQVLEAGAILGLPFDRELLVEVGALSPVAVEAGLDELILRRLIQKAPESGGRSGRYEFAHELVRRHVYQGVPVRRGEELSHRTITALERQGGTDEAARAALVHHRSRTTITAAVRRRRLRAASGAAALVLALGSAVLLAGRSPTHGSPTTIAVIPFTVSTTPELEYLGEGMVTLLSTKLSGVGTLRSVDPAAILGVAAQEARHSFGSEQGRRVAERVRAGTYITGQVFEAGNRIRIAAAAYRLGPLSGLLANAEVDGTINELFHLVDALAGQLLTGLARGPYDQLTRIAVMTTGSLPALKAYLDGERFFRDGRFHEAAQSFQRAAAEDTTFALAYYWLSVASWWADDSKLIDSAAARAVRYGAQLSERERRLFHAWEVFLQGDAAEAERLYRRIVGVDPENVEAWLQLGEVLFHSRPSRGHPLGVARKAFERVLTFQPEHTSALLHMARIAASEGRRADLDSLTRRILKLSPGGDWAIEVRAMQAFATRDRAAQRRVTEELRTASESRVWNTAHQVALAAGNLQGARDLIRVLTQSTRPAEVRAFGHQVLAHLELVHGRWRAAMRELDRAAPLDSAPTLEHRALLTLVPFVPATHKDLLALRHTLETRAVAAVPTSLESSHLASLHDGIHMELGAYLLGGLSLRLGDVAGAERILAELEQPRVAHDAETVARDAAESLRARLLQLGQRKLAAASSLEEVQRLEASVGLIGGSPFYSQGFERYLHAGLLDSLGRTEDALRTYDSFRHNSIFDLVYLAPSHLRRAEICERLGRWEQATNHYRSALALWRESDPEFQRLLERAKDRVGRAPRRYLQ